MSTFAVGSESSLRFTCTGKSDGNYCGQEPTLFLEERLWGSPEVGFDGESGVCGSHPAFSGARGNTSRCFMLH